VLPDASRIFRCFHTGGAIIRPAFVTAVKKTTRRNEMTIYFDFTSIAFPDSLTKANAN